MESPPPFARYVSQNSKKRVFPGGSSIDADVVEISQPINWTPKAKSVKKKEVIHHQIIDVDVEEDYRGVKCIDGNAESSIKGKEILVDISLPSTNCNSASDNPITIYDYVDDEHIDMYLDDLMCDEHAVLQSHFDNMDIPPGVEAPIPWMPAPVEEKMVSTTTVTQPSQFGSSLGPALVKRRLSDSGSMNQSSSAEKLNSNNKQVLSHSSRKVRLSRATASFSWQNPSPTPGASYFQKLAMGSAVPDWTNLLPNTTQVSSGYIHAPGAVNYFPQEMHLDPRKQGLVESATTAGSSSIPLGSASSGEQHRDLGEILKKFRLFKKFDTVQDHSDHYYSKQASLVNQHSKSWAKKIQEEWKILEKDLPDTIFVRVYETRMDLLRAVIMGADGTPYHHGLFFFDVFFPRNYPNVPPHVHYHSFGLRINPNLYNCGKVCLSLLNTWSGSGKEKWIPRGSTMLQVLVSIQGLILNAKPYFNEPGLASTSGTASGEQSSLQYNESTYIFNLKTMVYSMRRPPKHFEDFVLGHFFQSSQDILVACKAYMDGAQVGSLVRGGVQDVDEGDKSCSQNFKASLAGYIKTLVDTFTEIGAKDCDKYLYLAQKVTGSVPAVPVNMSYFHG